MTRVLLAALIAVAVFMAGTSILMQIIDDQQRASAHSITVVDCQPLPK